MANQMKIRTMTIRTGECETDRTLIEVNDETMIEIVGLGCGTYRWRVWNNNNPITTREPTDAEKAETTPALYNPAATIEELLKAAPDADGFYDANALGIGMVWASELTFAHVVMDIINNA